MRRRTLWDFNPLGETEINRVFASLEKLVERVDENNWFDRAATGADAPVRERKKPRGYKQHNEGCECPGCRVHRKPKVSKKATKCRTKNQTVTKKS